MYVIYVFVKAIFEKQDYLVKAQVLTKEVADFGNRNISFHQSEIINHPPTRVTLIGYYTDQTPACTCLNIMALLLT